MFIGRLDKVLKWKIYVPSVLKEMEIDNMSQQVLFDV